MNGYKERIAANANAYEPDVLAKIQWRIGITGQSLEKLVPRGVRIAFGTDAGVSKHGRNADEFELLVEHGMTPAAALQAATVNAADLLGLSNEIGTIAPGKSADIIAVASDPLADVRVLKTVDFVMARGSGGRLIKIIEEEGGNQEPQIARRAAPANGRASLRKPIVCARAARRQVDERDRAGRRQLLAADRGGLAAVERDHSEVGKAGDERREVVRFGVADQRVAARVPLGAADHVPQPDPVPCAAWPACRRRPWFASGRPTTSPSKRQNWFVGCA